jgi:hypothetical protein
VTTPSKIKSNIDNLTQFLVEVGLSTDQNFSFQRNLKDKMIEVTFSGGDNLSVILKELHYYEIYNHLIKNRFYNIKMIDGAVIQMMYLFNDNIIEKHRLSFFPSPSLEEFQNNPEIYLEDEIYADITAKKVVTIPLRFDFDARDCVFKELDHPKSHLTLGQYENCRIPVSSPLLPSHFIQFLLRNFYHTAHKKYAERLPVVSSSFQESILEREKSIIHIRVPRNSF